MTAVLALGCIAVFGEPRPPNSTETTASSNSTESATAASANHSFSSLLSRPILAIQEIAGGRSLWPQVEKLAEDALKSIELKGEVVIGTTAVDGMGQSLVAFLESEEGKAFVRAHSDQFLHGSGSDEEAARKLAQDFWVAFEKRLVALGIKEDVLAQYSRIYSSIPSVGRVELNVHYSKEMSAAWIERAIDSIARTLAADIAFKIRGGKIGTRIVERAVRRASSNGARLPFVQRRYDSETAIIREQILRLFETVPREAIRQGIEQRLLKPNLKLSVVPLKKPTAQQSKSSYYRIFAKSGRATAPAPIAEGYLHELDRADFGRLVRRATAPQSLPEIALEDDRGR